MKTFPKRAIPSEFGESFQRSPDLWFDTSGPLGGPFVSIAVLLAYISPAKNRGVNINQNCQFHGARPVSKLSQRPRLLYAMTMMRSIMSCRRSRHLFRECAAKAEKIMGWYSVIVFMLNQREQDLDSAPAPP